MSAAAKLQNSTLASALLLGGGVFLATFIAYLPWLQNKMPDHLMDKCQQPVTAGASGASATPTTVQRYNTYGDLLAAAVVAILVAGGYAVGRHFVGKAAAASQ